MLVNLLARQEGVVREVMLIAPTDQRLVGRIVPLADRALGLADAVLAGANAVGAVPVGRLDSLAQAPADAVLLAVGPGTAPAGGWRVHGEGWWGGVSRSAIASASTSGLPLGPYAAACLAAGEVFKHVRIPEPRTSDAFYSL